MTSRTAFIALIAYASIISIVLLAVAIVCGLYHQSITKPKPDSFQNLKKYDVGMVGEIDAKQMRQTAQLNMEKNVMILELYSEDNHMSAMAVIDQSKGMTTMYEEGLKMCVVIPGISKGMTNSSMANKYLEDNATAGMEVSPENTINYGINSNDNPMQDDSMIPAPLMTSCSNKPMYWMGRNSTNNTSIKIRNRRQSISIGDKVTIGGEGVCLKRSCFRVFGRKICLGGCVGLGS